jgi:hypothetical protein
MVAPVPIGPGTSFSAVGVNIATSNFTLGEGYAIMTFQPLDVNNPGVATLYDSDGNTIIALDREGYGNVMVPSGGLTYYFKATLGAKLVALTQPTTWR